MMFRLIFVGLLFVFMTQGVLAVEDVATSEATPSPTIRKAANPSAVRKMTDKIEAKRAAFQEQLQLIKDEKRQALVDRIINKIGNVNRQRTSQMLQAIEKMQDIQTRLEAKVATAKGAGVDTASAEAALAASKAAISSAEAAITSQQSEDYTPTLTGDETAKNVVGTSVSSLQTDLRTAHKLLVDAKQALMKAARAAAQLNGVKKLPIVSPTVISSPSPTSIEPSP